MMKKNFKLLSKLIISAALVIYLGFHVDWPVIYQSFKNIGIWDYVWSTLLTFASMYFLAWKYNVLIKRTSIEHSTLSLTRIQLISQFYALFIPSALGPAAVRWYKVTRNQSGRALFLASTIYERANFTLILLLFGIIPLFICQSNPEIILLRNRILPLAVPVTGMVLIIMAYFMSPRLRHWLTPVLMRVIPQKWQNRFSENLNTHFILKNGGPALYSNVFMLGLAWQILFLWRLYYLFQSTNVPLNIIEVTWTGSLVLLLQLLPVSFAGIGVREGAYAFLLTLYGFPSEKGVLIGILFFTQMILVAATGGILEILEK